MNTYIRYLMFNAIPTPIDHGSDFMFMHMLNSKLNLEPETFEDIENKWHIPEIILENEIQYNKDNHNQDSILPPPPSIPIKRSITVEYESCKTTPTPEHPDCIRFSRLKYASIGYYNHISSKTREMIYTLLNIKILESYKTQPQYWEGVDIKDYLYRTKQDVQPQGTIITNQKNN